MSTSSVLIIDSELTLAATFASDLARAIPQAPFGPPRLEVAVEADFSKARKRLDNKPPVLMVTALQLREYNGLQLVYLAATCSPCCPPRIGATFAKASSDNCGKLPRLSCDPIVEHYGTAL